VLAPHRSGTLAVQSCVAHDCQRFLQLDALETAQKVHNFNFGALSVAIKGTPTANDTALTVSVSTHSLTLVHFSFRVYVFSFSGAMVTLGMSEKFPADCPEQSGFVRATLIAGGYVFKPVPGGTLVTIVVQVSACGIVNSQSSCFSLFFLHAYSI
jgi:hypothetical protein